MQGISVCATHLVGTELTYRFAGNNRYEVTYKLFRDCSGTAAPVSANLIVKSESCNQFFQQLLDMETGSGTENPYICSGVTTCSGGTYPGVREYVYKGFVTLQMACADWKFSVSDCCRNAAISNLVRPETQAVYSESFLNNLNGSNSAPFFTLQPVTFLCQNQVVSINPGTVEADGDSLFYALSPAQSGEGIDVVYGNQYSFSSPLTSSFPIRIDGHTGDLTMTPTGNEIAILHFSVSEFRNGILIGKVSRDIQCIIISCTNSIPVLSGINGTYDYSLHACADASLSFSIVAEDADPDQSLAISITSSVPNAVMSTDSLSGLIQGRWTPSVSDIRSAPYTISITVSDNACPFNGVQTITYLLYVDPPFSPEVRTTPATCNGRSDGSASVSTDLNTSVRCNWSASGSENSSCTGLSSGNYTVLVTSSTGCTALRSFEIGNRYAPAIRIDQLRASTCVNSRSGSVVISAVNATEPVSYNWSNGNNTAVNEHLLPGNYSVILQDSNECVALTVVTIPNLYPSPQAGIIGEDVICKGNSLLLKGTGGISYAWNTGESSRETQVSEKGNYSVTVTDMHGCTAIAQKEIYEINCGESQASVRISTHESFLTLHFSQFQYRATIRVYTVAGQLISEELNPAGTTELSFSLSAHGIYLFSVTGVDGAFTVKSIF